MIKSISSTDLRSQAARVLNEVVFGHAQYVVEKHGEPAAAIIDMADFRLLQAAKEAEAGIFSRTVTTELPSAQPSVDGKTVFGGMSRGAEGANKAERRRKAIEIMGAGDSGLGDLSTEHDYYLEDAFTASET